MNMQEYSDAELIKAVTGGDQRAFERLILRYQDAVARFIWRLVPSPEDREEVCQDVFIKVFMNLHQFKSDSKFSTWLYSIAYRTAISSARKKRPQFDKFEEHPDEGRGPEAVGEGEELSRLLSREIARLDVEERAIVGLYHLQECGIDEIAGIMEKPSGTIKSILFRVRKHLKDRLSLQLVGVAEIGDML
ncbi:MAG: sigma-70 family RNA polymerase sigma factor [Pseudomonadales bacterium]